MGAFQQCLCCILWDVPGAGSATEAPSRTILGSSNENKSQDLPLVCVSAEELGEGSFSSLMAFPAASMIPGANSAALEVLNSLLSCLKV